MAPGAVWDLYYQDIVIVSANGSVHQVFAGQMTPSLTEVGPAGQSDLTASVDSIPNLPGDSTGTHYYLGDHLGTAQMEFSAGGWPVWQGQFAPFGQELDQQTTAMHYKFTGKERDAESGLDYFGARYYGASMGMFMSADPYSAILIKQRMIDGGLPQEAAQSFFDGFAENPQKWNGYTYALDNPLRFTDPTGAAPIEGHHLIPDRGSIGSPLARDFANSIKTGPLSGNGSPNQPGFNTAHREYNDAVSEIINDAEKTEGPSSSWSLSQWKDIANKILNSDEPAIKNFLDELEKNNAGAKTALATAISSYKVSKGLMLKIAAGVIAVDLTKFMNDIFVCISCSFQRVTITIRYGPPPTS